MKRIGVGFTGESSRDLPIEKLIDLGRRADDKGFESIWLTESYYYNDAITRLTALALNTRNMRLATGVINPQTRSPALIAMTMATLDEISHGRTILGIGASPRLWIYEKHLHTPYPGKMIRESVEIIRKLLAGEKISYKSSLFQLENLRLGFDRKRKEMPIYLAAVRHKMNEIAGEIADGVILTNGATPEYAREAKKSIIAGAKKAGRDPAKIDIASFVLTSISDDRRKAIQMLRRVIAYMTVNPNMDVVLEPSGLLKHKSIPKIREAGRRGDIQEAAKYVDDELTDALAATGTPEDCERRVDELRRAGVDLPILVPMSYEMFLKAIATFSSK
jgi:5,10-methylenetetrahydromethanopterin reductase